MAENLVQIAGSGLSAEINALGAELWTLRDAQGRDLLWNGDAEWWTGRAPILFPIVGTLKDDSYRIGGESYRLSRHGFARRSRFAVVEADAGSARFRLEANEETRAVYPFDFRLDLVFAITGKRLAVTGELTNTGHEALPASFGFHPAFRWPLPGGAGRDAHRVIFDREQTALVRRLDGDGLLDPEPRETPVAGRELRLDDDLFANDALIFAEVEGYALAYGAPDGMQIAIDYPDTPSLGLWSKPGAPFLCIEPWQGHSDPAGFAGEFADKPGIVRLAPDETRSWRMGVELIHD